MSTPYPKLRKLIYNQNLTPYKIHRYEASYNDSISNVGFSLQDVIKTHRKLDAG